MATKEAIIKLDIFLKEETYLTDDVQNVLRKLYNDKRFTRTEWLNKVDNINKQRKF